MELTLNLVWVGVAIVGVLSLVVARSRPAGPHSPPANQVSKVIAMGCTLVILFFVISMTDDLHDQQVLVEERKTFRVTIGTEAPPHLSSAKFAPPALLFFLPPGAFSLAPAAVRRLAKSSEFLFAASIERGIFCCRAPPILLTSQLSA
jgi:hypothetical protein